MALAVLAWLPASADSQFRVRQMTRGDVPPGKGQCDIRLQVYEEVEAAVRGDTVFLRTASGREARDDGSECNFPLPSHEVRGFTFEVQDHRNEIRLVEAPASRNNFTAIVRIHDTEGVMAGITSGLSWIDGAGPVPTPPTPQATASPGITSLTTQAAAPERQSTTTRTRAAFRGHPGPRPHRPCQGCFPRRTRKHRGPQRHADRPRRRPAQDRCRHRRSSFARHPVRLRPGRRENGWRHGYGSHRRAPASARPLGPPLGDRPQGARRHLHCPHVVLCGAGFQSAWEAACKRRPGGLKTRRRVKTCPTNSTAFPMLGRPSEIPYSCVRHVGIPVFFMAPKRSPLRPEATTVREW